LYAVTFVDSLRGYAVGARGTILRTDDAGVTWKDLESGLTTNFFAVAAGGRNNVVVTGDQGRVLHSDDAGLTWDMPPTITSSPLFSVAYRGGFNIWVAGRGGAILRRTDPIATVGIPSAKIPLWRPSAPKLQNAHNPIEDDDIPRAVPPDKKPARP
jgi:photosystem II stability/assembly factor-like uncharacterized protein